MSDEGPKIDDRVEYVRGRVQAAFKHLKADRIEKGFTATESLCVTRAPACRGIAHATVSLTRACRV